MYYNGNVWKMECHTLSYKPSKLTLKAPNNTDCPDMTWDVYRGSKPTTQQQQIHGRYRICPFKHPGRTKKGRNGRPLFWTKSSLCPQQYHDWNTVEKDVKYQAIQPSLPLVKEIWTGQNSKVKTCHLQLWLWLWANMLSHGICTSSHWANNLTKILWKSFCP